MSREYRRANDSGNHARHFAVSRAVAGISRAKTYGDLPSRVFVAQSLGEKRSLEGLAKQQSVQPVSDIQQLQSDFWPHDENTDDFENSIRQWRNEKKEKKIA